MPIGISRFQILIAYNCMVCFQYSGDFENDHFNSLLDHFLKCEENNDNNLQNASLM